MHYMTGINGSPRDGMGTLGFAWTMIVKCLKENCLLARSPMRRIGDYGVYCDYGVDKR
jgi:hypothetical protein